MEPLQIEYFCHPSAIVESPSTIGKGTKIWHWSMVSKNARIGDQCTLGQHVHIGPDVVIGHGVKIQNNVSVYQGVYLEDQVFCGPSVVFTNVLNPRSFIDRSKEFKKTLVCKGASLGANSTIVCGVRIGSYALVGAGSVVTKDIPDFALAYGSPARIQGWVDLFGNQLSLPESTAQTLTLESKGYRYILKKNTLCCEEV